MLRQRGILSRTARAVCLDWSFRGFGLCESERRDQLPARCFAFPFRLDLPLVFAIGIGLRIAGSILHVAPGLFGLALDLLRGTFSLGLRIAGPLANLALRAAHGIVDRSLHFVLVHTPPPGSSVFKRDSDGTLAPPGSVEDACRAHTTGLRPLINWISSTT